MISRLICVLIVGMFCVLACEAGEAPNDLTKYVLEARHAGLSDQEIAQNAAKAGWSAAAVADAIAAAHEVSGRGDAPGQEPETAETPKARQTTAPPDTAAVPVTSPAVDSPAVDKPFVEKAPAVEKPAVDQAAIEKQPPAAASKTIVTPEPKAEAADRGVPDDYVIGEGDVLHISVWKEPDASVPSVVVRPDGRISMPMLKEVKVAGLTPPQAEKLITEELTRFISTADVTVIVSNINSKKVYFVGGVKKEEPIPYAYRMTVLQGLSEAGGLTDYAKKKKIYVLRHQNGGDYKLPFDYDAVVKGQKMQMNIFLLPGDTVVVPR